MTSLANRIHSGDVTALDEIERQVEANEHVRIETVLALVDRVRTVVDQKQSLTALLEQADYIGDWEWSQIQEWLLLRDVVLTVQRRSA